MTSHRVARGIPRRPSPRGSLVLSVLEDVDCSVLLAEKKHDRGVIDRLVGRQTESSPETAGGESPASALETDEE